MAVPHQHFNIFPRHLYSTALALTCGTSPELENVRTVDVLKIFKVLPPSGYFSGIILHPRVQLLTDWNAKPIRGATQTVIWQPQSPRLAYESQNPSLKDKRPRWRILSVLGCTITEKSASEICKFVHNIIRKNVITSSGELIWPEGRYIFSWTATSTGEAWTNVNFDRP